MPFIGDQSEARSVASWRIYKNELERFGEYRGVMVLGVFVGNAAHLFTASKDVRTVEDWKGLKLRSPQPSAGMSIQQLGGVPIYKPVPEIYELASSGVIDGAVIPPEVVTGFKLDGAFKRMTFIPGGITNSNLLWAMNTDKFRSLRKDDQEAILRISGEALARAAGQAHDRFTREAIDTLTRNGTVIHRATPDVVEQMRVRLKAVEADWFAKARKKGLNDPERVLEALRQEVVAVSAR